LVLVGDTGYTDERHLYGNPPIRNSISRHGLQINVYHARQAATFSNSKWQEKTFASCKLAAQGVQEPKVQR